MEKDISGREMIGNAREVYEQLINSGILEGREGQTLVIDIETDSYAIGDTLADAKRQLAEMLGEGSNPQVFQKTIKGDRLGTGKPNGLPTPDITNLGHTVSNSIQRVLDNEPESPLSN